MNLSGTNAFTDANMSKQRSGFPATSSHLQNPHQIHDESDQSSNQHNETMLATDGSFISPSSTHLEHKPSDDSASNTPTDGHISHGDDGLPAQIRSSKGTTIMAKTNLYRLATLIATDSAIKLDQLNIDCTPLQDVSIEPPVTEASLAELNLERIRLDPKLRHDLNFDRDVSFRPNYEGPRGAIKKELAQRYWAVLAVELGYYMRIAVQPVDGHVKHCLNAKGMTWRLPRMFETIRAILLTLVQKKDASSVHQILDIDFLMQQLNHGVCDLVGLGEWLGVIIKSSCSPVRDAAATAVVDDIRHAVMTCNPVHLAGAIEQLFGVLETMKLDVANHQIRGLRLKMIADTVRYSRELFEPTSLDYQSSKRWFDNRKTAYEHHTAKSLPGLNDIDILARALVDVLQSHEQPPATFMFDMERIHDSALAFETLRAREAVRDTLQKLRTTMKPTLKSTVSTQTRQSLYCRLEQLDPSFSRTLTSRSPPEDILVEIIRSAYESLGNSTPLILSDYIEFTHDLLMQRLNSSTTPGRQIHHMAWTKLECHVLREVRRMTSLDEIEIHNYCERVTKASVADGIAEMATGRGDWSAATRIIESGTPDASDDDYRALAVKVAHVAVLHWRVWGPILYEDEWCEDMEDDEMCNSPSQVRHLVPVMVGEEACMADCIDSNQRERRDEDLGEGD